MNRKGYLTEIKNPGSDFHIRKNSKDDRIIALAGNPNVGKSTVFNQLTGLNQHTGNWPGKTVSNAQGYCLINNHGYVIVDIPGTYSLMSNSTEEEIARDFICFGEPDAVVVVCDATCLERNLNLVLQIIEISPQVVVCVNLMDEAGKKRITIDLTKLSNRLGVPVVGTSARKRRSLGQLSNIIDELDFNRGQSEKFKVRYPGPVEFAISVLEPAVRKISKGKIDSRWMSLKLLEQDEKLIKEISEFIGEDILENNEIKSLIQIASNYLLESGIDNEDKLKDVIVTALVNSAEDICRGVVEYGDRKYSEADRRLDKIFTSRLTGYPVMLVLLALVFWLTITGANYPSQLIAKGLFWFQDKLSDFFMYINAPAWIHGIIVLGVYRVLAWVVSVMLPPMAIFFPLFTLLEDSGYLPRVAFNLDKSFKKCCACGKQALCMCMGFGCNAAGVIGCRIIDSPRERLMAILTNNFVPCNGRFPTLIAILTMFFAGCSNGAGISFLSALLLTIVIVLGILITFLVTRVLSKTLLKGITSSFTLELPPYRKPQIGRVIIRSVFDRTLFVLVRAIAVAAPAGLVIWIMANTSVNNISVLNHCAAFLDPFARIMGLDGVILIAFILGFPANEIVIPIIIMAYMAQGSIMELDSLSQMRDLFVDNGWTWITAVSTMIFSLNHWPCSTTLITIKKETGSWKWTGLAAAIPTAIGLILCIMFNGITGLFF